MNAQRVVIGSDHAGFALKEHLKKFLQSRGVDVLDVGTHSAEPVDYPAIMRSAAAKVLAEGRVGIILGGSGNGEAMAANKVKGIRAAVCTNEEITRLARAHNDANVMSIGARFTDECTAETLVEIFLSTEFEGGRHLKRIQDLEP